VSGPRIKVVRADDLLVCELELDGLQLSGASPNRRLELAAGASEARLIVHLPTQHVAEDAFDEDPELAGRLQDDHDFLVRSCASGPSRVVFRVPQSSLPADYKLAAILDLLSKCRPAVANNATRPPDGKGLSGLWAWIRYWWQAPALTPPGPSETAIELPFRLILSPDDQAGFLHETEPVVGAASTRVALWHTRLGLSPGVEGTEQDAANRPVRAIWLRRGDGPDWSPTVPKWADDTKPGDHEPFERNSLSQRNRSDIVHVTANRRYAEQTGSDFYPGPISVRRLALSSLGAWLTSRGEWDPPKAHTPLLEWTHRATQGRDHFVRIVEAGFVYPFCHLSAKITITERKFVDGPGEPPVLFQTATILIRQPVREYPPGAAPPALAHTMPFRKLQIRTLITPNLEIPSGSPNCFLITPKGSTQPFLFKLTGTDVEGNSVDLAGPLVWVLSTSAWDTATINKAKALYDSAPGREMIASGAPLALAPGPNGDTTFAAEKLTFSAPPFVPMPSPAPLPPNDDQPGFWPELVKGEVKAPSLDIVAGQKGAATVSYHDSYRKNGLGGSNLGELIAKLEATVPLDFASQGDRAGGLMQPSLAVAGLSRQLGPVGGLGALDEVAGGTFDPKNFFQGAKAVLFGVFTLEEVLARITGALPADMPRIVTEGSGDHLTARVSWKPVPQSYPPGAPLFVVTPATRIEISATIQARGPSPQSDVNARIENFSIHLLPPTGFIEIDFEKIEFTAPAGRKPDIDVKMGEVRFVGPLSFVEELRKLIPLDGFSDPPALDVSPSGIKSSFSLALPDLPVGVFSLQNLTIGAGFAIPFAEGALTVSFNFCSREKPFLLTVSLFGGGGFFGLTLDPKGVQLLEASLEFGASAAIDLGVAQGGVHVMAGIYFKLESAKGCTLSGYFRLGGNMSVLGLISASIELVLSFTYQEKGKAAGRATLTIEIDIFLFSTSVEVSCERRFSGSASDPSFHDLMRPYPNPEIPAQTVRPWDLYCGAYA
jgi:hypothetical protein